MPYPVFITLAAVATGCIFSLGLRMERLRDVLGEHVPMEPAPIGALVLFLIGAVFGLYLSCLLLPARYLATPQGQKLMNGLSGTGSIAAFRGVCLAAVLFLTNATLYVLWYVYLFLRE